jgi:hypothetical protein
MTISTSMDSLPFLTLTHLFHRRIMRAVGTELTPLVRFHCTDNAPQQRSLWSITLSEEEKIRFFMQMSCTTQSSTYSFSFFTRADGFKELSNTLLLFPDDCFNWPLIAENHINEAAKAFLLPAETHRALSNAGSAFLYQWQAFQSTNYD